METKEVTPVIEEPLKEIKKPVMSDSLLYAVAIAGAMANSVVISLSLGLLFGDDTVMKFRASKAVEGMRLEIEAYKFEHGNYPETISVVSKQLDPWERPYIYKQGVNTFIVVSPGLTEKKEQ